MNKQQYTKCFTAILLLLKIDHVELVRGCELENKLNKFERGQKEFKAIFLPPSFNFSLTSYYLVFPLFLLHFHTARSSERICLPKRPN